MNRSLAVLAALLGAAPQEPSPDDLMKALRKRIDEARTVQAIYTFSQHFEGGTEEIRAEGRTRLKGKDRWTAELRYLNASQEMKEGTFSLLCDGRRIVNRENSRMIVQSMTPEVAAVELRRELATGLSSPAFMPDSETKQIKPPEIGPYSDLGRQTVDGVAIRVVGCTVKYYWDATPTEESLKIQIDPAKGTIRRIDGGSKDYAWTLTYTSFVFDEEIPDSEFSSQSLQSLAQARAGQIARSVELFSLFTGRKPRTLDELLRRPADLPPEIFWPEGGFILGGTLPKDPWGTPFVLEPKRVVSLGEDRKPGGDDPGADVLPTPRQAVAAPTERLKKQFSARVRIHLVAAAVRAFQRTYGELPKKRAHLWEKPEWATLWPEGGWIPGGKLPDDPWGQPLRLISEAASVRVQVQDPKARLLPVNSLTPEERAALETAAKPKLSDEEKKAIAGIVEDFTDDDLETREAAAKRLPEWGDLVLEFMTARLKTVRSPEAREWLTEAARSIPKRPPTWTTELGGLAVGVGQAVAADGEPTANERNALASLKTLASAQADFRANDRDGNRIQDFWTGDVAGLYCVQAGREGQPNKLIELSVAAADAAPLPAQEGTCYPKGIEAFGVRTPKAGYSFQAMTRDRSVDPPEEYRQDTGGGTGMGKVYNPSRFGFCTFPAAYGATGFRTFILNENNTVFSKDTGGEPVLEWPTDEELKNEWKKLD